MEPNLKPFPNGESEFLLSATVADLIILLTQKVLRVLIYTQYFSSLPRHRQDAQIANYIVVVLRVYLRRLKSFNNFSVESIKTFKSFNTVSVQSIETFKNFHYY